MFQQQASMRELSRVARNLGVSLHSGISIVKAFELAGRKTSGPMHAVMEDIVRDLKSGSDVTSALVSHGSFFPELFIGMVQVGESTGSLPEVLKAIGEHYENHLRLRKEFISQITMPVVQFVAAIFIIAGLICLLGWIGQSTGKTFDVLGWGLMGTSGALIWLGGWVLLIVSAVIGYKFAASTLSGQQAVHRFLLSLPVIGHCMRSFAIARFSWAFHLTQNSGMPIDDSIDSSLRATSNGAFIAAGPQMISSLNAGETLTEAFQESDLFPIEFIEYVMVAEQSGTVPEALDRLSPQFEEDARRSLQSLAAALSWAVWAAVACFIIFIIFTIALWYAGMIDAAMQGI
ncbi:type II secretion system F family protein [Planctomicrobium sp. SH661]|uniref:type II secretion system F family protein n=1 Tax=Planctomicrobium sp. SH661 TaxID=3448124 RepID=UPI003F5B00FD